MAMLSASPTRTNPGSWLSASIGIFASLVAGAFYLLFLNQLYSPLPEPWDTLMVVARYLPLFGIAALILGIVTLSRRPTAPAERRLAIIGIVTGSLAVFAVTILFFIVVVLLMESGRVPV